MRNFAYYGGKSTAGPVAKWIAGLLPYDRLYVEPFAGMAGVLCLRKPSRSEIINDIDGNVANWWRVCREKHDQLLDLLYYTPNSQPDFDEICKTDWSEKDDVWRAWAFTILLWQGYGGVPNKETARYGWAYKRKWRTQETTISIIKDMHSRMADVIIYDICAIQLLERLADVEDAVIYCDPPYSSSAIRDYSGSVNVNALTEAVLSLKSKVAISGYPGEWDHLGWEYEDMQRKTTMGPNNDKDVTERLWFNYDISPKLF